MCTLQGFLVAIYNFSKGDLYLHEIILHLNILKIC